MSTNTKSSDLGGGGGGGRGYTSIASVILYGMILTTRAKEVLIQRNYNGYMKSVLELRRNDLHTRQCKKITIH